MAEKMVIVGTRQKRFDGYDMVTGKLQYVRDRVLPNMLYAQVKVSPYAHAEVVSIDASKAKALPGVKAIITGTDVKEYPNASGNLKILTEKARKVNDAVAAVAATTPEIAQQAVDLIEVTYKVLPHVMEIDEALKANVNLIHTGERPEATSRYGDIEKGFKEATVVLDGSYTQNWIHPFEPERSVALASWNASEGSITIWASNQNMYATRDAVADFLGIPKSKVRVIMGATGSGFGGKGYNSNNAVTVLLASLLSQKVAQPVRLVWDLEPDICMLHGRNEVHYDQFRMGCKDDGTITALQTHSNADSGAYGAAVYNTDRGWNQDRPLRVPNYITTYGGAYTNKLNHSYIRGVATVPAHLALLLHCDRMAEKLGMNPLDFWLKNATQGGDMLGTRGTPPSSCALTECLTKAATKTDYRAKWHKPGEKTLPDGKKHGIAIVPWAYGASYPGRGLDNARVEINRDGSVNLFNGVQDQGQGSREVLALICAEAFKISSLDRIVSIIGDTYGSPYGPSSTASNVAIRSGSATVLAVEDAKKKLFADAAPLLKVTAEALDTAEHVVFEKANPANKKTFAEVVNSASRELITGVGNPKYPNTMYPLAFGAMVAEVVVDTDTGQIEISNFTMFTDCGRAINKIGFEQQHQGGAVMGMGYALYEGFQYDPATGKLLNTDFLGYKTFTALDTPSMYAEPVEPDDPLGPFGLKPIGESQCVAPGPCILNAIYNAIGVRFNHNTLTTRDILKALGKA